MYNIILYYITLNPNQAEDVPAKGDAQHRALGAALPQDRQPRRGYPGQWLQFSEAK